MKRILTESGCCLFNLLFLRSKSGGVGRLTSFGSEFLVLLSLFCGEGAELLLAVLDALDEVEFCPEEGLGHLVDPVPAELVGGDLLEYLVGGVCVEFPLRLGRIGRMVLYQSVEDVDDLHLAVELCVDESVVSEDAHDDVLPQGWCE